MEQEKISILYIDDEPNNLLGFKSAFRRFFDVHTAVSAVEGVKALALNPYHIVVADQRMPQVTGVQFFESILKMYPDPVRILLTGCDDIQTVVDAINKGQVFRYIAKPWKEDDLKSVILQAYEVYKLRKQKSNESNNFVYKVSHDLKGPLASLGGLINIARSEISDPPALKYFDLIGDSIAHLDTILSELLDFLSIDQKRGLSVVNINFKGIIDDVIKSLEHLEYFKGIEFKVEVKEQGVFNSDKNIIRSILQNLIQNAIKYRKYEVSSKVEVSVDCSDSEATIEIRDNGIGMTQEVLSNAFNMFYRGNDKTKGSGLGLYIVKTGVEKLHGKIEVSSIPEEGSVFTIRIPDIKSSTVS